MTFLHMATCLVGAQKDTRPVCNKDTLAIRVECKVCCPEHQCFLDITDPLHKNKQFNGSVEMRNAPKCIDGDEILRQLEKIPHLPGKHLNWNGKKCTRVEFELNWTN